MVDSFRNIAGEHQILLTSMRVAGMSLNLQVASRVIFVDYPPSASDALQGMARVVRYGAEEDQIIEILLLRYSIDQIIAHTMEAKYLPVIAGSANIVSDDVDAYAALSTRAVPGDPESDASAEDEMEDARDLVTTTKAEAIFRQVFGARTNYGDWGDLNVKLVANRQQFPGSARVLTAEREREIITQYERALDHHKEESGMSIDEAYAKVARDGGWTLLELSSIMNNQGVRDYVQNNAQRKGFEASQGKSIALRAKRRQTANGQPRQSIKARIRELRSGRAAASTTQPSGGQQQQAADDDDLEFLDDDDIPFTMASGEEEEDEEEAQSSGAESVDAEDGEEESSSNEEVEGEQEESSVEGGEHDDNDGIHGNASGISPGSTHDQLPLASSSAMDIDDASSSINVDEQALAAGPPPSTRARPNASVRRSARNRK